MKQPYDFYSVMRSLHVHAAVHETLTFALWNRWENTKNYWRTLFRRRVAWVRNWQATPMIANSKPVWLLTYERRRFMRWVPVLVAQVDTLDECFALVKHRRQAPVKFAMNDEGSVTGTTTFNLNFKVSSDATDELRPKDADYRAAAAGGSIKVRTAPAEETPDGSAQGGEATQDAAPADREDRGSEKVSPEVSAERS